ncbi:MAG TPA: hypothetical protein VKB38_18150 [Terracidiphilus sp.]|nr:hypothetical protein [Terracidiphilus sp.]
MYKRPGSIFSGLLAVALAILPCVPALAQQPGAENDLKSQADKNEKVHNRVFQSFTIGTIPDLLAKTTGDLTLADTSDRVELAARFIDTPDYPPVSLVDGACISDAVVVVTAVAGVSHLNADKTAIYSDWTMHVEEVLQDVPKAPIGGKEEITAVRPGGKLVIGGRTVYDQVPGFPEFRPGNKYLLFLTQIPETGAFKARTQRTYNLTLDPAAASKEHPFADTPSLALPVPSSSPEELISDTRAAIQYTAGAGKPNCLKLRGEQ